MGNFVENQEEVPGFSLVHPYPCGHLEREPADGRSLLLLSVQLSDFQIRNITKTFLLPNSRLAKRRLPAVGCIDMTVSGIADREVVVFVFVGWGMPGL